MFDQYLVKEDSLRNVYEDGKAVGFKFDVHIADYRGCFLSLVNGYYIQCDGVEYPCAKQKFQINGKAPRTYKELKTCVWEHWDYDDYATIYVEKEGGLEPGEHLLKVQQSVLTAYGYMPWDEEWVKNPPVPGSGAGSGKTAHIASFAMNLEEGGLD